MKQLKWVILAAVILFFGLVFGACPASESATDQQGGIPVSGMDLSSVIGIPWEKSVPVRSVALPEFNADITWLYSYDNGVSYFKAPTGMFYAEPLYQAVVSMSANAGYTFDGTPADSFTHSKAAYTVNQQGAGKTLDVLIQFLMTPKETDQTVSETDLFSLVSAPYRGGTPVSVLGNDQFSGSISWIDDSGIALTTNFQPDTAYKAVITPAVKSGYTLVGLEEDSFICKTAQSVSFDLSSQTITLQFGKTAAADADETITLLNLTSLVPVPVHRAVPVSSFETEQYEGTVAYYYTDGGTDDPVAGTFDCNRPFKALVTLTGNEGFTLTGLPANAFIHSGSTGVSNAAGSGAVTILFAPAPWTLGNVSYPRLGGVGAGTASDPSGWNASVEACCWPISGTSDRSGNIIVSSRNPGKSGDPSSATSTTASIGTNTFWDYAWNGDASTNRSSWQMFVGPDGVQQTGNSNAYQNGWSGGILTGDESGYGHPSVFLADGVPDFLQQRAHCFTIDLQSVRSSLATFEIYPRDNSRWPTVIEVYYSRTQHIDPIFTTGSNPDTDIVSLGTYTLGDIPSSPMNWHAANLFEHSADGMPISARYLHIRVLANQGNPYPNQWDTPSFVQIRLGVSD